MRRGKLNRLGISRKILSIKLELQSGRSLPFLKKPQLSDIKMIPKPSYNTTGVILPVYDNLIIGCN